MAKLKISLSLAQLWGAVTQPHVLHYHLKWRSAPSSAVEKITKSEIPPTHWNKKVEILRRYAYTAQPTMQHSSNIEATLGTALGRISHDFIVIIAAPGEGSAERTLALPISIACIKYPGWWLLAQIAGTQLSVRQPAFEAICCPNWRPIGLVLLVPS